MIKSQVTFKLLLANSKPLLLRPLVSGPASSAFHTGRALGFQKEIHEQWTKPLSETKPVDDDSSLAAKIDENRFVVTWEHPHATLQQLHQVSVAHHQPKNFSDRIANKVLLLIRSSFDLFTGYHHPPKGKENDPRFLMSEKKWLERFVFLESIAGVPGMVGGMVRHLHSLRLMRRDKAWIETLLEEAYNERMHLLIFMKLSKPGMFMRLMLLGAQGVFFNLFFVSYLLFPRICHRFVGYLEEEAIVTYTRCIEDIEAGRLSDWNTRKAPQIAIDYYHMPPENQTMLDLVYYVRADEAKHREVNHTFGNLDQKRDRNPYALKIVNDKGTPQPSVDLSAPKPTGWERAEIAA